MHNRAKLILHEINITSFWNCENWNFVDWQIVPMLQQNICAACYTKAFYLVFFRLGKTLHFMNSVLCLFVKFIHLPGKMCRKKWLRERPGKAGGRSKGSRMDVCSGDEMGTWEWEWDTIRYHTQQPPSQQHLRTTQHTCMETCVCNEMIIWMWHGEVDHNGCRKTYLLKGTGAWCLQQGAHWTRGLCHCWGQQS